MTKPRSIPASEPPVAIEQESAGVAWYPPAVFAALRQAGMDIAPDCASWDAWFDTYQAAFVRLKREGYRPFKIVVDPTQLATWLKETGRRNGGDAHLEYVRWRLQSVLQRIAAEEA